MTLWVWLLFSVILVFSLPSQAQQNLGGLTFSDSQDPLEIYAIEGITWDRKNRLFIASGQAQARSGERTIEAETLTAHYREASDESMDIWLIEAKADVKISLVGGERATGKQARYEVSSGVATLWGGDPQLISGIDIIGAREKLIYNSQTLFAQAIGRAYVQRNDRILMADKLDVRLRRDVGNQMSAYLVNAVGSVCLEQGPNLILAKRGTYNVDQGFATLRESVQLWQGQSFLKGEKAEANLNTGFSRILPGDKPAEGRVVGVMPEAGKQQIRPKTGCN